MNIEKILVNVEAGVDHQYLLEKTLRLAEASDARVELFRCCYNTSLRNSYLFDKEGLLRAEHGFMNQAERELEVLAEQLEAEGVDVDFDVCWERHHADSLVRKVLRYQPDILLHQIEKHSRLGHFLFAQSDWQLIRECPVPLMLVKEHSWSDGGHVAATVDPFHECESPAVLDSHILDWSAAIAQQLEGEMRVMHCFNVLPHSAIFDEHVVADFENMQVKVRREHIRALDTLLEPYGLNTDSSRVNLLEGPPHRKMLEYADDHHVDLLVMGAVARGVFDRLMVGSTIERILDSIHCDIMVVKGPDFECHVSES
ncbi:universal stress protein [Aliamphritea hakodatensis]|uniref:universal stress protein n=1 Tax=Aliamphritea hakodatensis TaxID=2895352 RepID=UPI0022FD6743|nr:universal stress protein [Aliamphritea hakodatensis]